MMRLTTTLFLSTCGLFLMACGDLTGNQPLPAGTVDPNIVSNKAGARALANGDRVLFQIAFMNFISESGMLTDELHETPTQITGAIGDIVDARQLIEGQYSSDGTYLSLQKARVGAQEAIAALNTYDADSSRYNRGELYARAGYSELQLADLYCSGVPLSTVNYKHDYTYAPSSTAAQVYQHAVTLFDSALALASDSAPIAGLARVGKGRALLALGRYADAATAVTEVPIDFQYADSVMTCVVNPNACNLPSGPGFPTYATFAFGSSNTVSDREGLNGLPFISSGDPRTAVYNPSPISGMSGYQRWFPKKYVPDAVNAFVLASGVEAQLMVAEAALHANDTVTWLSTLNALRARDPRTSALPAIKDPGTPNARIDTLFAERAAWLFLTGTRQFDMRRLVKQYGRLSNTVYPIGPYPGTTGFYGKNIDVPVGKDELVNPLFKGCLSRDY